MLYLLGGAVLVLVFSCLSCAVSFRVLRVLWLACRCLGAVSGAAGWARRNTPVFAGMTRRACGSRVVSSWPVARSW